MNRDELKTLIKNAFQEKYQIDISFIDESTPATKLSELNSKIDSLEFLSFLFEIEEKLNIRFLGDIGINSSLKEIIDTIHIAIKK